MTVTHSRDTLWRDMNTASTRRIEAIEPLSNAKFNRGFLGGVSALFGLIGAAISFRHGIGADAETLAAAANVAVGMFAGYVALGEHAEVRQLQDTVLQAEMEYARLNVAYNSMTPGQRTIDVSY